MAEIDSQTDTDERQTTQIVASHRAPAAGRGTQSPAPRAPNPALAALMDWGADLHDPAAWPQLMDQDAASSFLLLVCGVKLRPKSLQKRRVKGDSPPFRKVGSRVAYPRAQLKAWGDAQAGPIVKSTSELTAS
jgi:hypothetical protein